MRALIKKYGPQLGALYFDNEVAWDQIMKKLREEDEDSQNPDNASEPGRTTSIPQSSSSGGFADFSVSPVENDEVLSADPELLNKKTL